jgi:hypothetical protein
MAFALFGAEHTCAAGRCAGVSDVPGVSQVLWRLGPRLRLMGWNPTLT